MRRRVGLLAGVAGSSLVLSMIVMGIFEKGTNPDIQTFFDVFWWWVVTSTTVGYGDIVPVTLGGQIMAIFAIFSGFYIFTSVIAAVAESAHAFMERRVTGKAPVRFGNHILICEYTAMADELIQSLPSIPQLARYRVAIASDLVERNPYPEHAFVRGVPINPTVLRQANCSEAALVFIFANFRFADPDIKTLHIASRVRELSPEALVFVELIDEHSELTAHIGGDLVVLPSRRAMEYVLQKVPVNPLEWMDDGQRRLLLDRQPPEE